LLHESIQIVGIIYSDVSDMRGRHRHGAERDEERNGTSGVDVVRWEVEGIGGVDSVAIQAAEELCVVARAIVTLLILAYLCVCGEY
jgi:hypothetical protein